MRILLIILLLLAPAQWGSAQTKPKSALDKAALEAYLRHVELYRGTVTFKIDDPKPSKTLPGFSEVAVHLTFDGGSKDEMYYVSADGQTIVNGDVYNINRNPFEGNVDRLTTADQPAFGSANAPVTIVEFGDLECPDCRMEAPILRHNVRETFPDQVRVFFKDFPLESVHPWARAAAIAGRCVYRQDHEAFWKFYDWDYENQQDIDGDNLKSKVVGWAGQNGLDAAKLGQCIDTKATEPEIDRSIAEGRALGIRGTPTLFINGRKIGGLQWPDLQLVINNELTYQAAK
ncbi:MAG: DsbA family protein [Acidobacteriia bacterium]|nr:DsbA family protein [Terriglobia bacterium]